MRPRCDSMNSMTKKSSIMIYIVCTYRQDKMELRMKNFKILGVHEKIQFLRGGGYMNEKPISREGLLKKVGLVKFVN